jgi:hypothetical protein
VFQELKKDVAAVDQDSSYICQLLSRAEAMQITTHTDPASTPFILDLSHPITRVSSDMMMFIADAGHPLHPQNQDGIMYFY